MLRLLAVLASVLSTVSVAPSLVPAQGIQQSPYGAVETLRRGWWPNPNDLAPSNPLGLPGGSSPGARGESIPISSGMFRDIMPEIPNLQLGYIYNFGPNVRSGSASVDYLLPLELGPGSTIFGEAHGEYQSFWKTPPESGNYRVDLSLGGGYRRMVGDKALLGVNAFSDNSKVFGAWHSSGGLGLEVAAMIAGDDAIDLTFNWYGKLFDNAVIRDAFRYGPENFDVQAGYSRELYSGGPDLRLSVTGYTFETDSRVYGYYAGAELKSRNGTCVLKYDVGQDRINETYQSVGAFVNIGFQLENLFAGKSPLVMPEPIFESPRNPKRLTEKVKRNWRQAIAVRGPHTCPNQTITIRNNQSYAVTLYMGFLIDVTGGYNLATDFPGWTATPGNKWVLSRQMDANSSVVINFNHTTSLASIAFSVNELPWTSCANTMFEVTLCGNWGGEYKDTYDISLVNGFNYPMEVVPTFGDSIKVTQGTGNATNKGVFGWGWTDCVAAPDPPCTPDPNERHEIRNCQFSQSSGASWTVDIPPKP